MWTPEMRCPAYFAMMLRELRMSSAPSECAWVIALDLYTIIMGLQATAIGLESIYFG